MCYPEESPIRCIEPLRLIADKGFLACFMNQTNSEYVCRRRCDDFRMSTAFIIRSSFREEEATGGIVELVHQARDIFSGFSARVRYDSLSHALFLNEYDWFVRTSYDGAAT